VGLAAASNHGEKQTDMERAANEAGLKQVHENDHINGDEETLRQARAAVQSLTAEHSKLQDRQ
jgi:hypothetical protein